jgi:hypothetical protein
MIKITKPAEVKEGFHGMLYGKPKTGKTSTADDPKFKVLICDMEGGTAVLADSANVSRASIATYEEFQEFTTIVQRGYVEKQGDFDFDLIMIDSISRLQELIKSYVVRVFAPNRKREISGEFGAMADWGSLRELIMRDVKNWHSLTKRGDKSVHAMWIAHEGTTKDEMTDQTISTKIQLQGKDTADIVMAHVDGIFYMFNKVEDDVIKRGVLTKNFGIYQAGVRQPKNREPLPLAIYNPVWSEIFQQIGYTKGGE